MEPITSADVLEMIRGLLNFPAPTVCRHYVMCNLLSLMEKRGFPGEELRALAEAVVDADDETAMSCLDQLTGNKP